jgi:hypothetical protein
MPIPPGQMVLHVFLGMWDWHKIYQLGMYFYANRVYGNALWHSLIFGLIPIGRGFNFVFLCPSGIIKNHYARLV